MNFFNDIAVSHGQILENVYHMRWFLDTVCTHDDIKDNLLIKLVVRHGSLKDVLEFIELCEDETTESEDRCFIVLGHYSINVQMLYTKYYSGDPEKLQFDFDQLEEIFGISFSVTDYDDLVIDFTNEEF